MKTIKKLFMLGNVVLFSLCSLSCAADMGEGFKDNTQYGKGYQINFYTSNRTKLYKGEDLEDGAVGVPITNFYNAESVNNFDCPLNYDKYRYLIIKPTQDVEIDEMYIYFNAQNDCVLKGNLYVTSYIPSKLADLGNAINAYTNYLEEKKANPDKEDFTFDYGDEPTTNSVSSFTKKLNEGKWMDVGFTSFYQGEEKLKSIKVTSSQYLLVQFYNNVETGITVTKGMSLEDFKKTVEERKKERIDIKLTNIMIHDATKK